MMLKRSLLLMMVAVFSLAPAAASLAAGAEDLHGRWALKTVEFGGETQDVPDGAMQIEFHADGTAKMFAEGAEPEEGTYSVEGNNLTISGGDGEAETAPFTVTGDTLVLQIEMGPGQVMKWTFQRTGDVENAHAMPLRSAVVLDASDVHGRWSFKTFSIDGEEIETPDAGSLIVEFYPDGTMKGYENNELVDEGTYTVENGKITVSSEGEEPESIEYSRDGNTLSFTMEMGPGVKGTIVLERLGDAGTQ